MHKELSWLKRKYLLFPFEVCWLLTAFKALVIDWFYFGGKVDAWAGEIKCLNNVIQPSAAIWQMIIKMLSIIFGFNNSCEPIESMNSPASCWVHGSVAAGASGNNWVAAVNDGSFANWECPQPIKVFADARVVWSVRTVRQWADARPNVIWNCRKEISSTKFNYAN